MGGTIDSSPEYDPAKKSIFDGSYISQALAQARLRVDVAIEPLMQKDSADLTASDRHMLLTACEHASESQIIVTHGTDTLIETARYLGERGVGGKTVVLTGSFVPLSQNESDGPFNIGYAVAAADLVGSGVWIAMGGRVFSWDNVRKNFENARFEKERED